MLYYYIQKTDKYITLKRTKYPLICRILKNVHNSRNFAALKEKQNSESKLHYDSAKYQPKVKLTSYKFRQVYDTCSSGRKKETHVSCWR